jgi:hypothetical protein
VINYFTTTRIWLHLQDFYNRGMTPERAKEVIEQIPDPGSHLNRNWIVETALNEQTAVVDLVREI